MSDTTTPTVLSPEATPLPEMAPRYSVREEAAQFIVRVELPGVPRESIEVLAEDRILSVTATKRAVLPEGGRYLLREGQDAAYKLNLRLGDVVDSESIAASYVQGVLEIRLHKHQRAQSRTIAVR